MPDEEKPIGTERERKRINRWRQIKEKRQKSRKRPTTTINRATTLCVESYIHINSQRAETGINTHTHMRAHTKDDRYPTLMGITENHNVLYGMAV